MTCDIYDMIYHIIYDIMMIYDKIRYDTIRHNTQFVPHTARSAQCASIVQAHREIIVSHCQKQTNTQIHCMEKDAKILDLNFRYIF